MTSAWALRRTRREAFRHRASLSAHVAAFAALGALGAAAILGARAATQLAPLVSHDVHVIAYLRDDTSSQTADAICDILRRLPGVAAVRKVDSDEALQRLRTEAQSLGGGATALLDGVEDGFLPRSLEVALSPTGDLLARANDLAGRLRKISGIAEVDAMQGGLQRLMSWVNLARRLAQLMFVLAATAGTAALLWSIGKGRNQRRELAHTLTLLGETPAGIRLPAEILGGAGALLGAAVGLLVSQALFTSVLGAALQSLHGPGTKASPALRPAELILGLVAALLVGWFSGRFTTPVVRVRHA